MGSNEMLNLVRFEGCSLDAPPYFYVSVVPAGAKAGSFPFPKFAANQISSLVTELGLQNVDRVMQMLDAQGEFTGHISEIPDNVLRQRGLRD